MTTSCACIDEVFIYTDSITKGHKLLTSLAKRRHQRLNLLPEFLTNVLCRVINLEVPRDLFIALPSHSLLNWEDWFILASIPIFLNTCSGMEYLSTLQSLGMLQRQLQ